MAPPVGNSGRYSAVRRGKRRSRESRLFLSCRFPTLDQAADRNGNCSWWFQLVRPPSNVVRNMYLDGAGAVAGPEPPRGRRNNAWRGRRLRAPSSISGPSASGFGRVCASVCVVPPFSLMVTVSLTKLYQHILCEQIKISILLGVHPYHLKKFFLLGIISHYTL